ncbi:hypothetical protein CYY_003833 [Polysphondylium violaceum]|uniref:Type A von Willebrand factor domain-containing protein n=1 Tax=Polysphondylium violaceum TaxID=133409 RepID=A0A8J4PW64_9MYCE|nr:hypothetical protein CYY_003833 [Polysphondylium violaceum]
MKSFFSNLFKSSTPTTSSGEECNQGSLYILDRDRDYKESTFYNYFRVLENSHQYGASRLGLISVGSSEAFKLDSFAIDAEMTDTCSTSVLTQKYSNSSKSPVEAKYSIPIPPYASVSSFVVEYQDQVLKAKIKENQKAQNQYNDTIASGGQSFLASLASNGMFTVHLGNIPQGESVTLRMTIVSEIGSHYGNLHYYIHKYWFPPGGYELDINLNILFSLPIKDIQVLNYKSTISYENTTKSRAKVSIKQSGSSDDLVIKVLPELADKPTAIVEQDPSTSSTAISLSFFPNFEIDRDEMNQKSEFIFLLDCSGSMSGTPIVKSKTVLDIIMRSLNENSKFNIYCFGSNFNKCFEQSKIYDEDSLSAAINYISSIDADLGGTELYPPIQEILQQPYDQEYPRQLFILTDGQVSARDELIGFVGKESNSTRIFTLGIGDYVDRELVIGLSNACKGFYEFIDDSNMQDRVMKLVNISMEPTFSNICIDWGVDGFVQSPQMIRPVFYNERMMIYGLMENNCEKKQFNVTITGNSPSGKQATYSIPIDLSKDIDIVKSNNVHTVSAFKIIHDLEYRESKKSEDNSAEIIRLSKKYSVLSTKTSFIVSIESNQPTTDAMVNVNVNVNEQPLDRDEDDLFSQPPSSIPRSNDVLSAMSIQIDCLVSRSEKLCSIPDMWCDSLEDSGLEFKSKSSQPKLSNLFSFSSKSKVSSSSSFNNNSNNNINNNNNNNNNGEDELVQLIKLQKAFGSWDSVNSLFAIPSKPKEINDDKIWITFVVIAKIMKSYASRKNEWDLVVQKATKWLKNQLVKNNISTDFNTLLESAKSKL